MTAPALKGIFGFTASGMHPMILFTPFAGVPTHSLNPKHPVVGLVTNNKN